MFCNDYPKGTSPNPTYKQVCTGQTGHAEVLQVEYDPEKTKYEDLCMFFFSMHDPTTLNRQGYSHLFSHILIYSHIFSHILIYSHIFSYILNILLHVLSYVFSHIYSHRNDRGTQYRSAIFYHTDDQKAVAENVLQKVEADPEKMKHYSEKKIR